MVKVVLKGCGRCSGDMEMLKDLHGAFLRCLQCGNHVDLDLVLLGDRHAYVRALSKGQSGKKEVDGRPRQALFASHGT